MLASVAGIAVLHAGGVAQLAVLTGSLSRAFVLGSLPFLWVDAVKALVAALTSPNRSPGYRAPA